MGGFGHHDVFIENPIHNQTTGTLSIEEVSSIVHAYYRRFNELENEKDILFSTIFRNFGPLAGSSLRHPHSQLVSTTIVPLTIRTHLFEAQHYFDTEGRCAYCDMVAYELAVAKRVILENQAFVALVPFAAGKPYEVWLIPKKHAASFGQISVEDLSLFADALRIVTKSYYFNLDKTAYNYVFRTAPYAYAKSASYHWHVKFVPHFKDVGAFELGSGIQVSSVSPETAAQTLRKTAD